MTIPPLRKPGEKIYAEDQNAIVRFLRRIGGIRGGKGVTVTHTMGGILIELQAQPEYVLPGVIVAVHAPDGPTALQDLSQVTYDVTVKGRPEFDLDSFRNMTPVYGRPDTGVDGVPARVGDDCRIHFRRRGNDGETELRVLSEKTVHVECETPPASTAAVAALMAEVARLSARLAAIEGGSVTGGAVASGQVGGPQ